MTGPPPRTIPAGPLVELVDRWLIAHADHARPANGRQAGTLPLNELFHETFGFDRGSLHRWRRKGRIGVWTADRIACRLGLHPFEIWGDDWWRIPATAVEPDPDAVPAA